MARTGRPKHSLPKARATVYIDKRLIEAFDHIDFDPFLERRAYNYRNIHVETALREYLEKHYPEMADKFLSEKE